MSDAQINLALDHLDAGRLEACEAVCRRVLAREAKNPHALRVLSNVRFLRGDSAQAVHFGRLAARHAPEGDAEFLWALVRVMRRVGTYDEVRDLLERGLAINPRHPDLHVGLVEAHLWGQRFPEAVAAADRADEALPGIPEVGVNRAIAEEELGHADAALARVDALVAQWPDFPGGQQLRATVSNYVFGADPQETLAAHRRHAEHYVKLWRRMPPVARDRTRDGRLRVGFLSPDLRQHSVSHFIEPIVRHLDRARFHVSCFMTSIEEDAVSRRIAGEADAWHSVALYDNATIAQRIRAAEVDVLVECSGYTAGHRLGAVCMGPAPVQVTYCGYPNTTALPAIAWRIVDSHTDPAGEPSDAQALATERLLRLDPCFLCYQPPADAPEPAEGPAARGEPVTLGSFNALKKTNDQTLVLWGRMMAAVPGSRLVIKNASMRAQSTRADLLARLERAGIDPARVTLLEATRGIVEHLASYAKMDIALDTFPYHGTTTTCEALFMGVPVASMAGRTHASRVGLSLLWAAGRPEWVDHDPERWVSLVAGMAGDHGLLTASRRQRREALLASALCDGPAMAGRFGEALMRVWAERQTPAAGGS